MRVEDSDSSKVGAHPLPIVPWHPSSPYHFANLDEPSDLIAGMAVGEGSRDRAFLAALDDAYASQLIGENSRADLLKKWLADDPELRFQDRRRRIFLYP